MAATRHIQARACRLGVGFLAGVSLAGCAPGFPGPDALELATIPDWKAIPRSSPAQFVAGFDRFCVNGSRDPARQDEALRAAGYVPGYKSTGTRPVLYVVDDWRPAVLVGARICGVRAQSRTGQTDRLRRYIATTFPEAMPVSPERFRNDVEQVWQVEGGMIGTMRNVWEGNRTTYTVLLFRPEGVQ